MSQAGVVAARARIDDSDRALRIGQQMVVEGVIHVSLAAHQWHLVYAPLVEPVVALIAVESSEQQTPTAFAESQREERLPDELMRNVRGKADIQDANEHLLTVQRAHLRVPRNRIVAVGRCHFADVTGQIATLESLGEGILQPHAGVDLNRGSLLIRQMSPQQHLRLAAQRAAHAVDL